ncbi:MAG: TOBE domain-containing protein, partial [Oscillospiraceae bacterium]|nr:TOBE domain-containing protein [Oscillospiraceae bacterium]
GFIGMPVMNFFDAELKREGEKFFVELGGYRVELDPEKEARLLKNNVQSQPVTLGVRPEHTDLVENGVKAKVDVSEMMGSSVHLHLTAEGRDVIIIVPTIDMKGSYHMGDSVEFGFKGNVAHVFSKETDKNLEF